MPQYPADTSRTIRILRFVNVLDDSENKLSPVKINLWASNLTAVSAGIATVLGFFSQHLTGIENLWGGVAGYLSVSHAAHYADKREQNLQKERMK